MNLRELGARGYRGGGWKRDAATPSCLNTLESICGCGLTVNAATNLGHVVV